MTSAELRTQVYELTGRPSNYARLTSAQIDQYVNEGMMRLAQETLPPALLSFVTVTTANGTAVYEVAGSPLRVVSMQVGGNILTPATLQRLYVQAPGFQSASNGTPTHWINMGRDGTSGSTKVRLYPVPSSILSVSCVVLQKPAALPGSGQILEWDELEQYALAAYAAWRHFQNKTEVDGDDHAGKLMGNFQTIVDSYRRNNSADSYNSQEAGVQAGWRTQPQVQQ